MSGNNTIWTKENWVNTNLTQYPGSRRDVLEFIWTITNIHSERYEQFTESVVKLFSAGYCYYFALMLKDAFGGEVCLHYNHGHMVWMDTDGTFYDIYGVFTDYNEGDLIPISEVDPKTIENYRHRGYDDP